MNNNIKTTIYELSTFLLFWASQSISTLGSSMTGYALLIWVHDQNSSTMTMSLLAVCSFMPSILFNLFAGVLVDRYDKKIIMLICDTIAALGTLSIFLLMSLGYLRIWHIYIVNIIISLTGAFQTSADNVAISEIVQKKYYMKISGLQSLSSSLVGIITPAFATSLIAFYSIKIIFIIDILSFLVAFTALLLFIQIPKKAVVLEDMKNTYFGDLLTGFSFLKENKALMEIIIIFTLINLVAFIGAGGINTTVASMILSRIKHGKTVLGMYSTAVGLGTLIGSFCVTLMKPPKSKTRVIFLACAISFSLCEIPLGLGKSALIWILSGFLGNLPLTFLNSNFSVIMRTHVPIELQGRVFSTRDTLQYCTIPLGYLLGGVLADYVFEPFMRNSSFIQHILVKVVGQGKGSGIAVLLIFTGVLGIMISLFGLTRKKIKQLDFDKF